jgi:sigma-B regulation protein RsbU (phosphoserine phosphatase)
MVKDLRGHVAALTDATRAREAVESELRVARNIQNALLPRTFPPFPHLKEFDLHAVNAAARHIGGDFFDYFFVEKDVLMIVIADVSGKGVPAAMFMAVARTIIRNLAPACPSPGLLMTRTNALLLEDNTEFMFVTLFVARYNIRTGRLVYANGGHPQPYLLNGGRPTRFGEVTGTIVGVLPDLTYAEASAELKPGDRLVFYTDGVTEARSPSGEFLYDSGFEIMLATMNGRSAREICLDCIRRVTDYQADDIADDITVMVLQRN